MSSYVPSLYSVKFPKKAKLNVMTDTILNKYLFHDVPKNDIDVVTIAVIGRRGSGKSTTLTSIVSLGFDKYSPENVNVSWSNDIGYGMDSFDSKDVQIIMVDDAMKKQSSRRIHANTDKIGDYNDIRHGYRKKTGKNNGLIIVIWAWQRWMDLDPAFRESMDIVLLKTSSYSREKEIMIEMFGKDCYRYINENYDLIRRGDNKAKSRSIAHIVSLEGTGNENGVFILDKRECPNMPKFIDTSIVVEESSEENKEGQEQTITLNDLLESNDDKIKLKARCYEMIYLKNKDCRTTGLSLGISHSSAARYANDVKGLLGSDDNEGASA